MPSKGTFVGIVILVLVLFFILTALSLMNKFGPGIFSQVVGGIIEILVVVGLLVGAGTTIYFIYNRYG